MSPRLGDVKVGDQVKIAGLRSRASTAAWVDLYGPKVAGKHVAAFEKAARGVGLEVGLVVTVARVYVNRRDKVDWIEITAPNANVAFDIPADCLEKVD